VCTILFGWYPGTAVPIVLAANRDELRSRPSDPPRRLTDEPELWGGQDRVAGGTWLAVDRAGRLCAVTNRHLRAAKVERDAARKSRGELPVRVLGAGDDRQVRRLLDSLDATAYNPVNVLYLAPDSAYCVSIDDENGARMQTVSPGVHALTVVDFDDENDAKTARLLGQARAIATEREQTAHPDVVREHLAEILRSHDVDGGMPHNAACIHGLEYGTVSSATVTITTGEVDFRFADGPPCVTSYLPVRIG